MLPSTHPGKILLGEVLARDWNLTEAALQIGVDPGIVHDILMEIKDLTPELANKIAAATGTEAATWLRVQARYDAVETADVEAIAVDHVGSTSAA